MLFQKLIIINYIPQNTEGHELVENFTDLPNNYCKIITHISLSLNCFHPLMFASCLFFAECSQQGQGAGAGASRVSKGVTCV